MGLSLAVWFAGVLSASITARASLACELGVVGAGAGGAYAAWRAAVHGLEVCVFERSSRPGGRIHSLRAQGPMRDLVVEAGGYRFAPKPVFQHIGNVTWRIDTPLTAAVIKELKLPTAIYNPNASEWDHGMHKIVDAKGEDAGYLTFIERMLELAVAHGAVVRYNAGVVSLGSMASSGNHSNAVTLRLSSGVDVSVKSVLLNLPQGPLIELLRRSQGPIASIFPKPLYNPVAFPIMKLYVHYDDAWWRNDLGLVSGAFYNTEAAPTVPTHVAGVPMERPAPLQGQYHDGHVRCDLRGGSCRGFLQTYYGHDSAQMPGGIDGAIKYYAPFVDTVSADSATQIGRSKPHHQHLLEEVHAALVALHKPALDLVNATAKVAAMKPTGAMLSIWSQGIAGIHAGCHMPKRDSSGSPAVPGALAKAALKPLPGWPVFVANEAFGPMMCFAEGSLAMAEAALGQMNVSRPPGGWLSEDLAADLLEPQTTRGRPPTDPFLLSGGTYGQMGDILTRAEHFLHSGVANLHV